MNGSPDRERRPAGWSLGWLCHAALLVLTVACSPPEARQPPELDLPPYTAGDSAVFDDSFSPAVFGSDRELPPEEDDRFGALVDRADSIVEARITTVTGDSNGFDRNYLLVLRPVQTLQGKVVTQPIELSIPGKSPALVYLRTNESELVGKHVILLFRRFNVAGQPVIHWRAEARSEAVKAAIQRAAALSGLR